MGEQNDEDEEQFVHSNQCSDSEAEEEYLPDLPQEEEESLSTCKCHSNICNVKKQQSVNEWEILVQK